MLDKTFDPQKIEERHYREWESSGVFACDPSSKAKPFTIMMPPPNVTGSLHIGHALNSTLQDVLTRYERMRGRDALWQPGTDHAGIATQMVVERQLAEQKISRRDLGRTEFVKKIWEWKEESGGTITRQLRRLGTTPDWQRERFTMDEGMSRAVLKAFVQMYKEGLIYRDKRLVNWDPKLHTAISDLEVEQKEQKGSMWHIKYAIEDATAEYITVATTRPETMLGDTAVAVHPDDERYKHLVGKSVVLPITGRLIPIIADEYSDPEKGSGAVKITPAHDFNDFNVGKRHNLPMISVLDTSAKIAAIESIPKAYHGLDRFEARKKILAELDEQDLLEKEESVKHAIPYGDRSGVVIEPYLTDQWYCDAPKLAIEAIKAVETGKTVFVPKTWENTYFEWMRNIQPWCISRQLWWGHQIPVWYGPVWHTDIPPSDRLINAREFVAETEEEMLVEARKYYGPDYSVEIGPRHGLKGKVITLMRDPDVLDTWFSSGLWPFSTLDWPDQTPELKRYYPGDVLVTGFDIIFFWVARMMMMGIHFMGDVPFKTVYVHALVRDSKGQKMSKSKGNVMDPLDLIDKFGADALRFTLAAMAAQGRDIKLSEDRVEGYRNFATKLWNAARYCEMNECKPVDGFDPAKVKYTPNKWIIGEVAKTQEAIDAALTAYKFNDAANAVYSFTWNTFCDWYIEFTKPILTGNSELKDEVRATMAWVLDQTLLLLNPFMPFITEELYATIADRKDKTPLIERDWPQYKGLVNPDAANEMDWVIRFIGEIRSVRADMNVPAAAKIQLLVKGASKMTQERLKNYDEIIRRLSRLEQIAETKDAPKGSIQTIVDEATLALPIADIIDLDKEKARLKKEIEKLEDDIKKVDEKLGNQQFVSNAPPEIITEFKTRKATAESARKKLSQALQQLSAA
jgi:valyl-tRNA synthetase